MAVWSVEYAKSRLSEPLDACQQEGPQLVSRRGTETAVLVPIEQWRHLHADARPSLKELLLSSEARTEFLLPPRGSAHRRPAFEL